VLSGGETSIDGASRRFDLSTLETIALPVKTTKAARKTFVFAESARLSA
jgi:hypothetical protein